MIRRIVRRVVRRVVRASVRALVVLAAALGAVTAGAPVTAGPVAAHGDAATLGIEVTATGPLTVRVRTLLRYAADGHTAPGATVSVVATGPDGRSVGPVTLADTGDGTYAGGLTVPVPGRWTVAASAAAPSAEARADVTVTGTPAAATTLTTPTTPTTPTTATAPAGDGSDGDDATDDPLVPIVKYLVAVLGVALVTATVVVGLRLRR